MRVLKRAVCLIRAFLILTGNLGPVSLLLSSRAEAPEALQEETSLQIAAEETPPSAEREEGTVPLTDEADGEAEEGGEEETDAFRVIYFQPNGAWRQGACRFAAAAVTAEGESWIEGTDRTGEGRWEFSLPYNVNTFRFVRLDAGQSAISLDADTGATTLDASAKQATGSISDPSNVVTITNEKNTTIDIGVITEDLPFVAMIALAGAALILLVARKKKASEV